ncbi:MAG: tetratricopeptide repeat protein [Candidatus Brocadiia bacterium]
MRYVWALLLSCAVFSGFIILKPKLTNLYVKYYSMPEDIGFESAPEGYCLVRSEPISATQVESWKKEAKTEHSNVRYALFSLGVYYLYRQNNPGEGLQYFGRVQREYPSTCIAAAALFESGMASLMGTESEEGLRALELFCTKYPNSWRVSAALLYEATYYKNAGDKERAAALCDRIVMDHPTSPQNSRAQKLGVELYRALGKLQDSERLSLLVADATNSNVSKAEALAEWLDARAESVGPEEALKELSMYLPVVKGVEARKTILQAAINVAFDAKLDAKELELVTMLSEEGLIDAERPPILWRRYEIEARLGREGDAARTLNLLVSSYPASEESRRAEEKLNTILSAGIVH